jgi:hypothetical protein
MPPFASVAGNLYITARIFINVIKTQYYQIDSASRISEIAVFKPNPCLYMHKLRYTWRKHSLQFQLMKMYKVCRINSFACVRITTPITTATTTFIINIISCSNTKVTIF